MPEAGASRAREVLAESVTTLYRHEPLTRLAAVPALAFALAVLWNETPHAWLAAWSALIVATVLLRAWNHARWRWHRPGTDELRHWAWRYAAAYAVTGLAWGAGAVLLLDEQQLLPLALLLVLYAALSAGAVTAHTAFPPAFICFIVPLFAPVSVELALSGSLQKSALAAGLMAFVALMIVFGRNVSRTLVQSIERQLENADLAAQLRAEKAIAEAARLVAEEASLAKSRLFAAASHDLRQPLQSLELFAAGLDETQLPPQAREAVSNIQASVHALGTLFDSVLDISRFDAGVVKAEPAHFALMPLFDRLRLAYQSPARAKGLALRVRPSEAWLHTDPALLERVLGNLLTNALRYTERGGVLLACRRRGARVAIEVYDTGVGIPAAQVERVFEEFYQLGNPERDRTRGLGLGLAIVRRIADLSGMRVQILSRPGRGTLVRVTVRAGLVEAEAPPQPRPQGLLEGRVVVVIEDEASIRNGMAALLRRWGCEVLAAGSLDEVLENARTAAPDVILSDYRLRENRTGVEAIQALRARWGRGIPAILISGDTAPDRLREARQGGFPMLHKPVAAARLRAAIAHAIGERAGAA